MIKPLVAAILLSLCLFVDVLFSSIFNSQTPAYVPKVRLVLRGGQATDLLHTGRFVIEHRKSNFSMERTMSAVASLDDLYDVKGVLGEGGFATVRKGTHRITKNVYAVKTIDLAKIKFDQLDSLRNEVNIMKMLDHPNVVKLYETFEEDSKLHLVLELCEGGDLFEFIMNTSIESGQKSWSNGEVSFVWTEGRLADVARKMLSAVGYLHQRGIAHRDIKPENFLLESKPTAEGPGEIKIIDFGFSKVYHGTDGLHNMLGSAYYVAPEVLGANKGKGYGPKCDVWSLGVVFYMMLAGQPPFDGDDIYDKIGKGDFAYPPDVEISDDAKDFIAGLLTVDPEARSSAAAALKHRWITAAHDCDPPLRLPSMSHLSRMRGLGRLKKEALLAIGYSLRKDQIRDLSLTFRALDKEGTGVISLESLREGMRRAGMAGEVAEKIFENFQQISQDPKDGKVEYTSFVAACLEKRCYLEQANLHEAFHRFRDADGYITADSLRSLLGGKFSVDEVEDMVHEADLDSDGRISFAEFSLMMGNRLPLARVAWRALPLLEGLDADEVAQVFEISQVHVFESGQDLMVEGDPAESFFMVEEGSLELTRRRYKELHRCADDGPGPCRPAVVTSDGRRPAVAEILAAGAASTAAQAAATLAPLLASEGDKSDRDTIILLDAPAVVGEMEMLNGEHRMASVTATGRVKAREVSYAALTRLMERNNLVGYKVMTNIARIAANSVAQLNMQMSNCNAVLDLYAASSAAGLAARPRPRP